MKTTAVIIARFQTPYLHEGHRYLIDEIRQRHNRLVIVLGISPVKASRHNPFDFYTREKMLKQYYPGLVVLPLKDHACDTTWSHKLDQLLKDTFPDESFILYGSRDCFIPQYSGHLPVEALPAREGFSATALRDEYSDRVLESDDFRLGINYACQNNYTRVNPTVDIALLKENNTKVLLGRKPGVDHWRFPGGFADVTDTNFEMAARRELQEECGAIETATMQYIGSARIDDWRYRSESDAIMTMFFKTQLLYGEIKANDDLDSLEWFDVHALKTMVKENTIDAEHHILVDLLLNNLQHTTSGEAIA